MLLPLETTNTTANIIAASATVVTALGAVILGILQIQVKKDVGKVHVIVNQQRTDMQRYIVALTQTLKLHGITIPIDQSVPIIGPDESFPVAPPVE